MNKIIFSILCLATVLLGFSSCESNGDLNSCNGLPVIFGIKNTVLDSTHVETGALGDWLIIEGDNFCDINDILFNDISVNRSNTYIELNKISLSVPRIAPYKVTNTITLVTSQNDSVHYPFELYVPEIVLKGLLNEYVEPGETAYIEGDNFDIHQIDSTSGAWITFGEKELAVYRMSSTRLSFKVPEDAQPNTAIRLFRKDTLDNLRVDMQIPGLYLDNRNILYSGDPDRDKTDNFIEHTDGLGLTGFPEAINGPYYYFNGEYTDWAWGDKWMVYTAWNMGEPMNTEGNRVPFGDMPAEDLEVVFEVYVVNDWTNAAFKINLWDGYEYHWAPYGSSAYRTNGWETVRISLDEFKKPPGTGESFPVVPDGDLYWVWKNRSVMIHGLYQPNIFICWDNLRIVPKIK